MWGRIDPHGAVLQDAEKWDADVVFVQEPWTWKAQGAVRNHLAFDIVATPGVLPSVAYVRKGVRYEVLHQEKCVVVFGVADLKLVGVYFSPDRKRNAWVSAFLTKW